MKRRLISVLLVLCMLLAIAPVSIFAAEGQDAAKTYVSLGASNVNGYGHRGYLPDAVTEDPLAAPKAEMNVYGYEAAPKNAYPAQVAKKLGVQLKQLAISSMRTEELRVLLDNEYYGDAYTEWRFTGGEKWFEIACDGGLEALRAAYQKEIKNADYITVDIGWNNFGVYAFNNIKTILADGQYWKAPVFEDVLTAEEKAYYDNVKQIALDYLKNDVGVADAALQEKLEMMADTLAYATMGACYHFDIVMEKIYELNPDATVVSINIQNLADGLVVDFEGIRLNLGDLYGKLIEMTDLYRAATSSYADRYLFADAGDIETFLDEIVAWDGNPETLGNDMKDCFDMYDDSLYVRSIVEYMMVGQALRELFERFGFKDDSSYTYEFALERDPEELLALDLSKLDLNNPDGEDKAVEEYGAAVAKHLKNLRNFETGKHAYDYVSNKLPAEYKNAFDKNLQGIYDAYNNTLNYAYDVVATIVQYAASIDALEINANTLSGFNAAADGMMELVANDFIGGAMAKFEYELYKNGVSTTSVPEVPEYTLNESIIDPAVRAIAVLAVRYELGNSFFAHPNTTGHKQTADAIMAAIESGSTGKDVLEDEAVIALEQFYDFVLEYYDEAYAYGYAYAAENDYVADAVAAIDGVIADLKAIDLSDAEMTDAFKAEAAGEIKEIIDILEAAKALLLEADVLDQATLDSLIAMLNEAGEAAENLLNVLDQAASDVVELAIIPAVKKALDKLENEVVPAIIEDLQDAVDAGTAWLMEQAQAAYDAMVAAIVELAPKFDQWAYDWLYNNPDKVIAFFKEYGDEGVAFLAEHKDVIFTVLGYLAQEYGDDVVDYVLSNPEEVLAKMCQWAEKYGDRTWDMILVYLDELGLIPTEEEIEAVTGALKDALDQLITAADTMTKKQLQALVDILKEAAADLKEAVVNSPEIQALIKEVEAAIAALEALVNDFENAAIEALQAALEDVNDALKALVDAAKVCADSAVQDAIHTLMVALYDATHGEYTVSKQSYYVSLGDSTVTGYGADFGNNPEGYGNHGYMTVVPDSFPYMLAEKLGLDLETEETPEMQYIQLAMAGLRTNDLLYILDESKTPDDYFNKRVLNEYINVYGGSLETVREDYKRELAKADLVTIAIGNCNFTGVQETGIIAQWINNDPTLSAWMENQYFGDTIKAAFADMGVNLNAPVYATDWDSYFNEEEQAILQAAFENVKEALIENGIPEEQSVDVGEMLELPLPSGSIVVTIPVADLMSQFIEWYTYCYVTHAFNYDDVLDKIHEMTRPDAQVVVVGMFNPMDELVISYEGQEIAVGEYIDYALGVLNLSGFAYAMLNENTTYVPVHDVESVADYDMAQTGNIFELIEFINKYATEVNGNFTNHHETVAGHAYIAECIYNALTVTKEETGLLGDVNTDGVVDSIDAAMILAYDVDNIDEEDLDLSVGDVSGDGVVDSIDAAMILAYDVGNMTSFPAEAN